MRKEELIYGGNIPKQKPPKRRIQQISTTKSVIVGEFSPNASSIPKLYYANSVTGLMEQIKPNVKVPLHQSDGSVVVSEVGFRGGIEAFSYNTLKATVPSLMALEQKRALACAIKQSILQTTKLKAALNDSNARNAMILLLKEIHQNLI
jgi:hypothetical protein